MADSTDYILKSFIQQEAAKQNPQIAAADPYSGLMKGFGGVTNAITQASANPEYELKDKLLMGLVGGLLEGGANSLSQNWQGRAQNELRDSISGGYTGESAQRDLLPASVFDSAQGSGEMLRAKSVFEQEAAQTEMQNAVKTEAMKQLIGDRPDLALDFARGDFSGLDAASRESEAIAKTPGEFSIQEQIATKVPKAYQKDAIKEAGTISKFDELKPIINKAIDTANANTSITQRVDGLLPFGMSAPNYSEASRARATAKAQIVSVITPVWKGPLGDTDIALIIDPFVPADGDSPAIVEQKREGLFDLLKSNTDATPTLDQFGVSRSAAPTIAPGAAPTAPTAQTQGQMTAAELTENGYIKVEGGWRKGPPRTSTGTLAG